ncbi:MAG: sensor histidine kinase [Blastocatellia bacterium]
MTTAIATDSADLISVLRVDNDVTEKLKRSHDALAGEVHRLRGELNEKNLELQRRERLAALGQMAAGVAHEIRNPLGGIGLYASLLQQELKDCPEQKDIARKICSGVRNVENIIRDILEFAGGGTQRSEPLSLAVVLEGVVAQISHKADELGTVVEVNGGDANLWIKGDLGRIVRALVNLALNALEAAGAGGHVWIQGRRAGNDMVAVVIEDDGAGISSEVKHKIFNPFFTTKDYGTGLGLAIVHSIAESHGGFVRAGSREGGGASFVLTLPGSLAGPKVHAEHGEVSREHLD